MSDGITLIVADDHPIFLRGLCQLLERHAGLSVLEAAANGDEALLAIERLRPRVAILDVDMPRLDGLGVARAVRDRRLRSALILLTMHKDASILDAALSVGVLGFVVKDSALLEIVDAVQTVAAGRHHVSPQLSTHLVARHDRAAASARVPGVETLTDSERKVLRLLAEFKTTKEIAGVLCISPRTVDRHRANMVEKLSLSGSHALTRFAVEHRDAV